MQRLMDQGSMGFASLRILINSISRFIHLVTCCMSKTMPADKEYRSVTSFLMYLKPVLDDISNHEETLDEAMFNGCEELDFAVGEARIFLEKWSPKMSKIVCVLESKALFTKIQISSVKLSCVLCRLSELWPTTLSHSRAQFCIQELQKMTIGKLSRCIEDVFERQREGKIPATEDVMMIIESLGMNSKQEFLRELIALEKLRQKAEQSRMDRDLDQISLALDLMDYIRCCVVIRLKNVHALKNVQIPPYFCCPLSLELMTDPVIVSSGQTYESVAIQKWLDHGLMTCPKTRVQLSDKNIIPNYTIKTLIDNWCSENKLGSSDIPPNTVSDVSHMEHTSDEVNFQSRLEMRYPTPRSSPEIRHGFEKQKENVSPRYDAYGNGVHAENAEKFDHFSLEQSYVHSRSESVSSAISSIEHLPMALASTEISLMSSKHDGESDRFGDATSNCLTYSISDETSGESPSSGKAYDISKSLTDKKTNRNHNPFRTLSFSSESVTDDLTNIAHVEKLIEDLKSESAELQTASAGEIRFLAKYNVENRFIIVRNGAIVPLISLLHSNVKLAQEHAVTALLNLSINENLRAKIAEEDPLEPLIHVVRTGNGGAKENAAATLFSLSLVDDYRIKIGRSHAVKLLVDLLGSGTVRGKKDAAAALFNLSICHENKARIVQAGAIKYLVMLMDPSSEMVDKAVALLANLSTITEGRSAIVREGAIPLLVDTLDTGSQRGKENASSILLQLCINSPKYCRNVLQEGVVPPLVALTQSGTPRAKEKAQQLLSHFRDLRERGKPRKDT